MTWLLKAWAWVRSAPGVVWVTGLGVAAFFWLTRRRKATGLDLDGERENESLEREADIDWARIDTEEDRALSALRAEADAKVVDIRSRRAKASAGEPLVTIRSMLDEDP